jgi:hypothetical protein
MKAKLAVTAGVATMALTGQVFLTAPALSDDGRKLEAVPFEFVGKADDCGAGYAAGSRIVTAAWLKGMGLPDNGGMNSNSLHPTNNPNKKDRHSGLLLSKNGPTPDCSAAGASIKGVKGMTVSATFEVGFDYRNGGHCGAGAPRFNVTTRDGAFSFVGGCSNGTASPAPQDPSEWTRIRINVTSASQAFPPLAVGSEIESISIIYDEGTDTATSDTLGVGLAVLDNIYINGELITGRGHDGKDDD